MVTNGSLLSRWPCLGFLAVILLAAFILWRSRMSVLSILLFLENQDAFSFWCAIVARVWSHGKSCSFIGTRRAFRQAFRYFSLWNWIVVFGSLAVTNVCMSFHHQFDGFLRCQHRQFLSFPFIGRAFLNRVFHDRSRLLHLIVHATLAAHITIDIALMRFVFITSAVTCVGKAVLPRCWNRSRWWTSEFLRYRSIFVLRCQTSV